MAAFLSLNPKPNAQIENFGDSFGKCSKLGPKNPYIFHSLSEFECVIRCHIPDSTEKMKMVEKINNFIYEEDKEFGSISPKAIWYIYELVDYEKLVFLEIANPRNMGYTFSLGYNLERDKFYFFNKIEDIQRFLDSEDFRIFSDWQILKYCWIVTALYHNDKPVKFLTSIKELILDAVINRQMFNNLEGVKGYDTLKIELPSIEKNWDASRNRDDLLEYYAHKMIPGVDTVNVSFYIAYGTEIFKVNMSLSGRNITYYKEEFIGNTLKWYQSGPDE
jgi:hypothetical protein